MRYALHKFSSISKEDLQKLASLGIEDSDQLLERAALLKEREALAREGMIPLQSLTRYASLADLVRVKGVGVQLAEILVDSGAARTVQHLVDGNKTVGQIRQIANLYVRETGLSAKSLALSRLKEICSEARELRPRLSLYAIKPDPSFRKELYSKAWMERKHALGLNLAMVVVILIPIMIMGYIARTVLWANVLEPISPYSDINHIYGTIQKTSLGILDQSAILIVALLLGSILLLSTLLDIASYLQNTWLVLLLFPKPSQQNFYRDINSIDLKKQVRSLWRVMAFLALLGLAAVMLAIRSLLQNDSMDALFETLAKLLIPGGIFLGVMVSIPVLNFFLRELPRKNSYSLENVKRYLVWYASKVMMIPIMVVLFSRVVFPLALSIHANLVLSRVIPDAREQVLTHRQDLVDIPISDTEKEAWREYAVDLVDDVVLSDLGVQGIVITPEDRSIIESWLPLFLNMVVWIAITAFFLLFVVPYLILGGWGRGLFYMFLLYVSFELEDKLTLSAPTWFSLSQNGLGTALFVAFFVFINALFFDWLFDTITNKQKSCPACKTDIDRQALYCFHCSFQQE